MSCHRLAAASGLATMMVDQALAAPAKEERDPGRALLDEM